MKIVIQDISLKLMFNILKNYLKKQKLKKLLKASKLQKLVANLHDKTEYVIDIKNLKEALNHGLVLEKVHGVFMFNQKTWLKSYLDMNTELRKNGYNNFEKRVLSELTMQFLQKLWKMGENMKISNL